MRLDVSSNGWVDDLAIAGVTLEIHRVGDARYTLRTEGVETVVITLWTTRKDRVVIDPWADRPAWAALDVEPDSVLVSSCATECDVHFENLSRNAYFLGLSRGSAAWGLTLRAHGYIRTRVEPAALDGLTIA